MRYYRDADGWDLLIDRIAAGDDPWAPEHVLGPLRPAVDDLLRDTLRDEAERSET